MSETWTDNPRKIVRVATADGSHTLRDLELDVTYRSLQGARAEARWVFLNGTRITARPGPWRVLEFGFGAATSASELIAAHLARRPRDPSATLTLHTVEHAPIPLEFIDHLPAPTRDVAQRLLRLAASGHKTCRARSPNHGVDVTLHVGDFTTVDTLARLDAHAVFFDPFGPRSNPDSWGAQRFACAARHMHPEGILATFSAATAVRRAMAAAGLHVGRGDGFGTKRECTLAALDPAHLAHAEHIFAPEQYAPPHEED